MLLHGLVDKGCRKRGVCEALDVSRASFYRSLRFPYQGPPLGRSHPKNRLPDGVRREILALLHEERFVDLSPWEVVPRLLDQGSYLASIRTFYRILAGQGEAKERRLQGKRGKHSPPILEATEPNQVWSWDITRLKGHYHGLWHFLYVMLDIFSRYVVGWMVADHESSRLAQHFIRQTVQRNLESGRHITIHNDRGSPMKAAQTRELFSVLGLSQSFSRPRTSDDNPFSEAQFRTVKYHHDYPPFFNSKEHATSWTEQMMTGYNNEHMHAGLNGHTPASVHFGWVGEVIRKRQEVLDAVFAANPERFPKGRPLVKQPPKIVGINLHLRAQTTQTLATLNQLEKEALADVHQPGISTLNCGQQLSHCP